MNIETPHIKIVSIKNESNTIKGNFFPVDAMSCMQVKIWKIVMANMEDQGKKRLVFTIRVSRFFLFFLKLGGMKTQSAPPRVMVSPISTGVDLYTELPFIIESANLTVSVDKSKASFGFHS